MGNSVAGTPSHRGWRQVVAARRIHHLDLVVVPEGDDAQARLLHRNAEQFGRLLREFGRWQKTLPWSVAWLSA
ncbi:MAG: hypothetical protein R2851_17145 [Caldilineaceae bacterium]